MNTNALRQKILDLAIHGKLVKQNPDDESAAILLEKIRAEKEKKIASGELKRGKNDSYIFFGDDNRHYEKFADGRVKDIEDEIPFAVPEGWAWCRLSNISASIFAGGDRPIIYEKTKSDKCSVPIYSNGIENNGLYGFTDKSVVNVSSLTISARGTIGFSCIRNEPFVPIIRLITIIPFIECINLVFLKFSSDVLFSFSEGSSIPQLTVPTVKQFLLPLPPLAEQQRIVAKIETIFAQIDLLEQNKADLQTVVKQAKSKILDLAIRGKLVPQDPDDEPASVMLEKLRVEKEAKIASGEIKRGKNDSYIYKNSTDNCYYEKFFEKKDLCIDNEIPFELPENWQWTKLGRICDKLVDGDHNPPKGIEEKTEYIMVSSRNINHNTVEDLENVRYLTKEMFDAENLRTNATAGDIFFTSVGSLGRSCIYDGRMNICFQRSVSILNTKVYNKYVKFFFDSNFYQNYVAEHATGTAQMGFYLQEMAESFIAIPPISEQKRIVAKIEEIFNALDDIQRNLV